MRLSEIERNSLEDAIKDVDAEVYLFGSRVDNSKKGGDIDILVFSNENPLKLSQKIANHFFSQLDSKIDVLVLDRNNLSTSQRAFLNTLQTVRLK
jgi:predicted nucleotidyltransferase